MKSFVPPFTRYLLPVTCALLSCLVAFAGDIELPAPVTQGGKPLLDTLKERKSERKFSARELTSSELSNLLWAADGITRPDGRRTAPTARNAQEIELYVVLKDAVYLFDYVNNKLKLVLQGDIRPIIGNQPFVTKAPVNILMVLNYDKINWMPNRADKKLYGAVDSGFIDQNIYLYCTSVGMSSVFRAAGLQREEIRKKLNLPESYEVLYAHTVGFPKTPIAQLPSI
ncbi:MAG: nitroreductase family protein [Akkermansia sp.]